jgi:hypothetical protein
MVNDKEFAFRVYENYQQYREKKLNKRRIKHSEILSLINLLKNKNIFSINKVGESTGGREINLIKIGEGKTRIFLWSQMHGDEPTATMAIFDILNFFASDDEFNNCRKKFKKKLTIYFMPMVNPDGAELFQRENLINIDLNRDASSLQTVEAKLLMNTFKSIKAKFGFNLHDQSSVYSAGEKNVPATISFLSPPYNFGREINRTRSNSMKIIGKLSEILSWFIPGHIAKYNDEFEPRAFGDNFQRLGMSTVLIESGAWRNDTEKQFVRRINFIAMLSAFKIIADKSYGKVSLKQYNNLPNNEERMMDLIIRKVSYFYNNKKYVLDLGINRTEINCENNSNFYFESKFEALGDLSVFYGYEDYDFEGMTISEGKTFPKSFHTIEEIRELDFISLYKNGYTNVQLITDENLSKNNLPINIIINRNKLKDFTIKAGNYSNLYIKKYDKILYIIVNGFLFNLNSLSGEIKNGIIVR